VIFAVPGIKLPPLLSELGVSGETYEIDIRIEEVRVRKSGRAIWCRSVSDGWYLSGFRFV
jgi:hypothetical protein